MNITVVRVPCYPDEYIALSKDWFTYPSHHSHIHFAGPAGYHQRNAAMFTFRDPKDAMLFKLSINLVDS